MPIQLEPIHKPFVPRQCRHFLTPIKYNGRFVFKRATNIPNFFVDQDCKRFVRRMEEKLQRGEDTFDGCGTEKCTHKECSCANNKNIKNTTSSDMCMNKNAGLNSDLRSEGISKIACLNNDNMSINNSKQGAVCKNSNGMRDEGMGDEGMGDEGMGDEGMGDEGMGDEGMGNAGMGNAGMGDEGTNNSSVKDSSINGINNHSDIHIGINKKNGTGISSDCQCGVVDRRIKRGIAPVDYRGHNKSKHALCTKWCKNAKHKHTDDRRRVLRHVVALHDQGVLFSYDGTLLHCYLKGTYERIKLSDHAHSIIAERGFIYACIRHAVAELSTNQVFYTPSTSACINTVDELVVAHRGHLSVYSNGKKVHEHFFTENVRVHSTVHPRELYVCTSNDVYVLNVRTGECMHVMGSPTRIQEVRAHDGTLFFITSNVLYVLNMDHSVMAVEYEMEKARLQVNDRFVILYSWEGRFLFFERQDVMYCGSVWYEMEGFEGFCTDGDVYHFVMREGVYSFVGHGLVMGKEDGELKSGEEGYEGRGENRTENRTENEEVGGKQYQPSITSINTANASIPVTINHFFKDPFTVPPDKVVYAGNARIIRRMCRKRRKGGKLVIKDLYVLYKKYRQKKGVQRKVRSKLYDCLEEGRNEKEEKNDEGDDRNNDYKKGDYKNDYEPKQDERQHKKCKKNEDENKSGNNGKKDAPLGF